WPGPREILYLRPRDPQQERWEGPRLGPDDPGIKEKTGFAAVDSFTELHDTLAALAKDFPEIYTELPGPHEDGYPQATVKDISPAAGALRMIKSPGELALIAKAIEPSIDAHFAAMKMMHAGLY